MAGQVALSAVILRSCGAGRLAMRVCMWTGSIVLLTADLTLSIGQVAFYCGSEVLLGAIIGRHFIGRRPSFSRSSSAQWTRLASGLHRCP